MRLPHVTSMTTSRAMIILVLSLIEGASPPCKTPATVPSPRGQLCSNGSMTDYTTFPTEAQNGGLEFVEHARNIGRAYQNQAMELIYICQLLSRVSLPSLARKDAELRKTLRVCDIALRSAADSGKEVTDEAIKRFKEATQVLSKYSKRFYLE
ncbi:hypothetical protein BJY52DRAFT_946885 [Lactarius psammicola]|nr:hypothetical protein BJY52DRAFT_946885 [Lactarius psammicola]